MNHSGSSKCPVLFLTHLVISICASIVSGLGALVVNSISFDPPFVHNLVQNQNRTALMRVYFERKAHLNASISLTSLNEHIAHVQKNVYPLIFNGNSDVGKNVSFTIWGHSIGKTRIEPKLLISNMEAQEENQSLSPIGLEVWVKRGPDAEKLNKIFVGIMMVLIMIANVLMGCKLDLSIVMATIKKPLAPAIGFATQFILMPLIAYGIGEFLLFKLRMHSFALGLFVTGCSPSGGASNFWTLLLEGNVDLSITMTFINTLAALGMMPLWMWLLGSRFLVGYSEEELRVPYTNIVTSLIGLIFPLCIGVLIHLFRPKIAAKMTKVLRPFVLLILTFIVCFGTYANLYMLDLMSWPNLISGILLPWCGFMLGCFFAILLGQSPANVTAVAIETGIQNTGIAIMLLKFSFSQPDADISSVVPVIVAVFTPGPLLIGVAIHRFVKYMKASAENADGVVTSKNNADLNLVARRVHSISEWQQLDIGTKEDL